MAPSSNSKTTYAKGTSTSVEYSRNEIEKLLKKYGATGFMYGNQGDRTMIAFEMRERHIRMTIACPSLESFIISGYSTARARDLHAQKLRELWRGLVLLTKAKLVAIDAGVTTLERAFLDDTVLPDDSTVGEWLEPQIHYAYKSGRMPQLLPGYYPSSPSLGERKQLTGGSGDYIEGIVVKE